MADYWKEISPATVGATSPRADLKILRPSNAALEKKMITAGAWAYVIAALSGLNLFLGLVGTPVRFSLGLQFIDLVHAVGQVIGTVFGYLGLAIGVAAATGFAALGFQARKLKTWPFYTLVTVVALDLLLFCLVQFLVSQSPEQLVDTAGLPAGSAYVGAAVHILCLLALISGATAAKTYQKRKRDGLA